MNIHGIYETSSEMRIFSSRREYQNFLQTESGASGSFFGFHAGVKSAYGSSFSSNQQTNLAVFYIDVDRYEIFKDEVKPQDLSRSFLYEFMNLPESYFQPGGPAKFSDFISRWGTHYIKSAKFGGQLQIRKLQSGRSKATKQEFAVEAEAEYRGLFASGGTYSSTRGGSAGKTENKFMSTSVQALGGHQQIAAAVADVYSPTFKTTLVDWLDSINDYPKAFKFIMGSITDLVDFRAADLFPDESTDWGCEANRARLVKEESTGKYYYNRTAENGTEKAYCEYGSRTEIEIKLKRRRSSLKHAIQAYMEEGPISATDISIPAGDGGCETQDLEGSLAIPKWDEISKNGEEFLVIFDMDDELTGRSNIPKTMSRLVKRGGNWWFTANEDGKFHLYNGFYNGGSRTSSNKKISIFGLVLTYAESDGSLTLAEADYDGSKAYFTNLDSRAKDKVLARVQWPASTLFSRMTKDTTTLHVPCNVKWSNPFRFDPNDQLQNECVHFTAFAQGTVYIVFSSIPTKKETWYFLEISKYGVVMYKGKRIIDYTTNQNAVSIGSSSLYQSYYACLTETKQSTVIEYGKTRGDIHFGDNYLTTIDRSDPRIHARFFTFANGENDVQIMDIQVYPRSNLVQECKGGTVHDASGRLCLRRPCHEACDEMKGCRPPAGNTTLASECYECKYAKAGENCVLKCPVGEVPSKQKICAMSYDLVFKSNFQESSNISIPSTLSDFTICLWMKFPAYKSEYLFKEYLVLGYFTTIVTFTTTFFELSVKYDNREEASLQLKYYGPYEYFHPDRFKIKLKSQQGKNTDQWHFICMTRESSSGNTHLFWYGKESISGSDFLFPGQPMKKGGKLALAGLAKRSPAIDLFYPIDKNLRMTITQINVWDRLLSNDEIATISGQDKCGGNPGNVLDWEDFKSGLTLSKFAKQEPSKCYGSVGSIF